MKFECPPLSGFATSQVGWDVIVAKAKTTRCMQQKNLKCESCKQTVNAKVYGWFQTVSIWAMCCCHFLISTCY